MRIHRPLQVFLDVAGFGNFTPIFKEGNGQTPMDVLIDVSLVKHKTSFLLVTHDLPVVGARKEAVKRVLEGHEVTRALMDVRNV